MSPISYSPLKTGHQKHEAPAAMSKKKRQVIIGAVMTSPILLVGCGEDEAEYPSQSIEYIIPYDPGGGADPVGREFVDLLDEELGSSTDVLNVPGGEETLGISQLVDSEPDGHNLGLSTTGGLLAQPMINDDAQYSGAEDVTPLAKMTGTPYGLFVAPDSEYDTLEDLMDAARDEPGQIQISSPSANNLPAFVIYYLEDQADVEFSLITTAGGTGEAALEVMAGRLDAVIGNASGQVGLVESGDLQPLAYSGTEDYTDFLPGAESFEEAGYDIPFTSEYLTLAPAGLPEDVEPQLREAVDTVITGEEWTEWADEQGAVADVATGDELDEHLSELSEAIEEGVQLIETREE